MTDITPPPELAAIWVAEIYGNGDPAIPLHPITLRLVERAAQWGYDQRGKVNEAELQEARDQELEACCEWLDRIAYRQSLHIRGSHLRAARRPKPPSLKKQALQVLGSPIMSGESRLIGHRDHDLLRRVLEALPDND